MAVVTAWDVRADAISRAHGEIGAPESWYAGPGTANSTHIRVEAHGRSTEVLRAVRTGVAEGQLVVAPGVLGLDDRESVTAMCLPLDLAAFRRYWLAKTRAGRLTLVGLLLAISAQFVDVALNLGEVWDVFDIGADGVSAAKAAKSLMTVGGLALAFWQGVLKEK